MYRLVEVAMWGDRKFCELSKPKPNGQSLWFFLLTGKYTINIPGIVIAKPAEMAGYLDWPLEAFRKAFAEPLAKGMAKADQKAGLVWLPKAPRHNKPISPNVVRSWRKTWDMVPECDLKVEIYQSLRSFCEGWGVSFAKAFAEALAHPLPIQDQEQEQEQDQDKTTMSTPTSTEEGGSGSDLDYDPTDLKHGQSDLKSKANGKQWPGLEKQYRKHAAIGERLLAKLKEWTEVEYEVCNSHMKHISARLSEGRSEDDLRKVIWNQGHEWRGTEQFKYMRPSTLFIPSKFNEYLPQARKAWSDQGRDKQ